MSVCIFEMRNYHQKLKICCCYVGYFYMHNISTTIFFDLLQVSLVLGPSDADFAHSTELKNMKIPKEGILIINIYIYTQADTLK